MNNQLLTPEDFIREGEALIQKGQMLIAYGERLKAGTEATHVKPLSARQIKKRQMEASALALILAHQDKYLAKQKAKKKRDES